MINTRMNCNYVVAFLFAIFTYFTGSAANYLTFTAESEYVKVSYSYTDNEHIPDIHYSQDGTNWTKWLEPIALTKDEKIYIKGNNPDGFSFSNKFFTKFSIDGLTHVSGSVMSLIDGEGESTVIPNDYCFYSLFKDCDISTAPELPATTLKPYCYCSMFESCSTLKTAPELPATEMVPNCYRLMFWSCSFAETPKLPAKKLAESCYSAMFGMCMVLEETPELPATELADSCYNGMFTLCFNLKKVGNLPAETLKAGCYNEMFQMCSSMKYIKVGCPSLDYNETDTEGATHNWFGYVEETEDCLFVFPCGSTYDKYGYSEVPTGFTIINSPLVVFQNADGTVLRTDNIACGETPNYGDTDPFLDDEHQFVKWDKELTALTEPDIYYYRAEYEKVAAPAPGNWLCFTANDDAGAYIGYQNKGTNNPDIQYSVDEGKTWQVLLPGENVVLEKEGERVFFKGSNSKGFSFNDDNYTTFIMEGSVSASGSVMSLIDGKGTSTTIPNSNCFRCLFKDCSSLTKAPELPATELKSSCYSIMFAGCTNLEVAPKLPATTLASSCYYYMFSDCVSLKEAPELPSTTLASACYFCMFINCKSFTKAPELPATELTKHCYQGMFQGCINLTEAPVLPATQMEQDCYTDMFHGCKSLVEAPALPAEILADGCYHSMFLDCTSLTEAPELPAMELTEECYRKMFSGCTSLTKAPELPSLSPNLSSYSEMFKGCTHLNYIKVGVMSLDFDHEVTENWVSGVDGDGVFIFPCGTKYNKHGVSEVPDNFKIIGHAIVIFQYSDDEELWRDTVSCGVIPEYNGPAPEESGDNEFIGWDKTLTEITEPGIYRYTALYQQKAPSNWLCFTAEEANSTFYLNNNGNNPNIECSLDDGKTWKPMTEDDIVMISEVGGKVYLRGNNPDGFSHDMSSYSQFIMSGSIAASGSIMSLVDEEGVSKEIPGDYCFINLFKSCRSLTQAPELPATTLRNSCYESMFEDCPRLTVAPELPATQLTTNCYNSMFASCESLMATPDLPATELAPACYGTMFAYCRNLTKAPDILPATVMYDHCYASMFFECVSLTDAPALPAETLAQYCYYFMFQGCTSLLTAPELPARTMKDGCYQCMFQGCTDLTQAPILISTALAPLCYSGMFNSCINLKSAPKLPAIELTYACYLDMFRGCASLEKAPDLLAEKLESACYNGMFYGCENLNYIKVGVLSLDMTSDMTLSPTEDWVYGIEGEGEFIFPCGSKYNKHGKSEVPTNFTITGSPIIVFQNPDGRELWRDTISCDVIPEYGGDIPTIGAGYAFRGWDKELTQIKIPDVYYYTAVYDEIVDPLANKWLCFTAGKDDSEVWYGNGANNAPNIQYSLDGGVTWIEWTPDTHIKLKKDAKVYVRGNNPDGFSHDKGNASVRDAKDLECTYFQMKGSIAASGNVMSLIDEEGSTTTIPCVGCFSHLFVGCGSLTQAPNLPAMDLTERCYESMFLGCSNLIEAPELPATTMADFCYGNMFSGCRKLSKAPVLPALKLAGSCYVNMFNSANLTEAPELPATELTYRCYANMFSRCANLVKAPALPAQELTNFCYELMFSYCTSLTEAPELPATTLVSSCYKDMFKECTNLNYIKVGVMTLDNNVSATREWVSGIDGPGVFIFPCGSKYNKHGASEVPTNFDIVASPIVVFLNYDGTELWRDTVGCDVVPEYKGDTPSRGDAYEFIGWDKDLTILTEPDVYYYKAVYEKKSDPLYNNWLCFTAEEDDAVVWYSATGEINPDVQYSLDGGKTWSPLTNRQEITLKEAGEKVYIKGYNPEGFNTEESYVQFGSYRDVSASGSVMSLIDGEGTVTEIPNPYCFYRLFYQNQYLTTAPELSATVLTEGCYREMFAYCNELIEAPVLPAVTMEERCYQNMFRNCSNLTKAPVLPAEEMKMGCYYGMFSDCYLLAEAPALPATTLADSCYCAMFNECHNLTKTPNLTATDMVVAAYMYMFTNCTSLTEVTSLPATHLERNCYTGMFSGCSSLVEAPALPATTLADSCYTVMFAGCRNMQTPPELPAEELSRSCYEYMFTACSSIVEAPILPATILKPSCYAGMFAGCSSLEKVPEIAMTSFAEQSCFLMFNGCYNLNYIKVGANTLDNEYEATLNWVVAIKNSGVFIFPCGSKYDKHGDSEVPVNFEIQSSPIVVFQNPDGRELYRDTIACDVIPEYKGDEPTYGEGLVFVGWDKPLTVLTDLNTYYFTAEYEEEGSYEIGNWLCFTAEESGSQVWYRGLIGGNISIQYSIDEGKSWHTLKQEEKITLENIGDKVYLKGDNPNGLNGNDSGNYQIGCSFSMSGRVSASGSVMSLIDETGRSTTIPNKNCFSYLFANCESLTQAPELPATTLMDSCYSNMFLGCTSLKKAPELPATIMSEACYQYMFMGCLDLTEMPELPATTLANKCYDNMFAQCESLTHVAELPAKTMADFCYFAMFAGCHSLTKAPQLPAMILAHGCYSAMFYDCVNLIEAPQLPATQLEISCYSQMFDGCTNLIEAPELPASELVRECYSLMFNNCSSLNYIKVGVMSLDNFFFATRNWVQGIDGDGTFVFPCGSKYDKHGVSEVPDNFKIISSPVVVFQNPDGEELYRDTIGCDVVAEYRGETPSYGDGLVFKGWDPELTIHPEPDTFYYTAVYEEELTPITDVSRCLCFTAAEKGSEVWCQNHGNNAPDIQYSVDEGRTWIPLAADEHVVLNSVDDKVYFKGINPEGFSHGDSDYTFFEMSGMIAASGSVMSLLDGEGVSNVIPNESCFRYLFGGCASLTKAPELPATTLSKACYMGMFSRCSRLTDMPELPATTLADSCYSDMFSECSKLIKTTELPATTLTEGCYESMFYKCISLTDAPELPATTLAKGCYNSMFYNCTSLTEAPELPATTLAVGCYNGMFYGCSSLTKAPELPATTLMDGCYYDMFNGCTSLTEAPELPAAELVNECYYSMFRGCSNLTYIKVGVMTLDGFGASSYWVYDVKKEGTFIFPCGSKYDKHGISEVPVNFKIISSPVVIFQNPDGEELYRDTIGCDVLPEYRGETPTYGEGLVFKGWDPELTIHPEPDTFYYTAVYEEEQASITDVSKCLCFTAEEAGSEVWYVNEMDNAPDVQYSVDGGRTWNVLAPEEHVVLTSVGDKVYLRGDNASGFSLVGDLTSLDMIMLGIYTHFGMTGSIAASGSVMSLIDGVGETTEIPNAYCFYKLFVGCSSLIQAPELSATTLKENCYESMFYQCTSLTQAPALPATKMADRCYLSMFASCSNLTETPQLPATELAPSCYSSMFKDCVSLVAAPELPATQLANACYASMFSGCTSLTETPKLIATTLSDECYRWMFRGCTSLTKAPELPATTLAYSCYDGMFSECSSLTEAPELPATTLAEYCYRWMFRGCTSLTKAPELPATELVNGCYNNMFEDCNSLNYIKVGVMSLDNNFEYGATRNWVSGVDGPGVFIFPCGSTYDKHGVSEVPDDFEILRGPVTVVFQNPDSTVLWKETINCNEVPEYKGETPTMGEGYFFIGWDKELTALEESESIYYITAMYEDLNKYESLHLTVDDALYLVLPGGSETIGYELLEGGGSRYEIWYDGVMITEGAVTNDSTVQLICPENFIPGAYTATLVMYDAHNGRGASDFVFHVMLKDDPTNSYYVKVWNDVVICRNGDNRFVSYQWYKNRKIVEGATLQYYNDVELLDGEYLVYVTDQSGKSYFIEPKRFEREETSYSITAEPSIVNRGADFTVVVSGVEPEQLKNARIVVYRNDGVVVNILDDVETENEMRLAAIGDYVIILTVNDGKNANCKVLIK